MLIVAILDSNHYEEKQAGTLTFDQHHELSTAMFSIACAIPFIIGLLQIIVWWPFSIRHSDTTVAKHVES